MTAASFESINIGDELPPLNKHIVHVEIMMYQAVTWDFTRVHYDREFVARTMGLPNVFVDGQMLGAYLSQALTQWLGLAGWPRKLRYRFRDFVYPGDTITCKGKVTAKYVKDGEKLVDCEMWMENQKGELMVAPATATVVFY